MRRKRMPKRVRRNLRTQYSARSARSLLPTHFAATVACPAYSRRGGDPPLLPLVQAVHFANSSQSNRSRKSQAARCVPSGLYPAGARKESRHPTQIIRTQSHQFRHARSRAVQQLNQSHVTQTHRPPGLLRASSKAPTSSIESAFGNGRDGRGIHIRRGIFVEQVFINRIPTKRNDRRTRPRNRRFRQTFSPSPPLTKGVPNVDL